MGLSGVATPQPLDDLWELDPASMTWRRISPVTRQYSGIVYMESHCECILQPPILLLYTVQDTLASANTAAQSISSVGNCVRPAS